LGAILLTLTALQQLTLALADTATATAAWRDDAPLLTTAPPSPDHTPFRGAPASADTAGRTRHVPAPGADALYHQPLIDNAMLAIDQWPPTAEYDQRLDQHLAPLALDQLIERMPNGLAQPLGQT